MTALLGSHQPGSLRHRVASAAAEAAGFRRLAVAAAAFEHALRLRPPGCDRRRARIQVWLARARLESGDADEALRLATAALHIFAQRGSAAGLRNVRDLRNAFAVAGLPSAADALDEQARCARRPAG